MYVIGISFLVILIPFAVALVIGLVARWILGPIDLAAEMRREQLQYTIADFLALILLVQIPMAAIETLVPGDTAPIVLHVVSAIACTAVWWVSVRKLSTAGVRNPWHRVLYLVIISPLAYFGSIVWMVVWFVLAAGVYEFFAGQTKLPLAVLTSANLALSAAFYAAARFTRRVASKARLVSPSVSTSVSQ
jgi:hypothetical protein